MNVEWLRLKPSGSVYAFDVEKPAKTAVCGRVNVGGTTNAFPPLAKTCPICTEQVGNRLAHES